MKTITVPELINFFAECDNMRNTSGRECSFDINYPKSRFEIMWGRIYETMEHEHMEYYSFDKNKSIEISDTGVVRLVSEDGAFHFYTFTKTLTLRDFQ